MVHILDRNMIASLATSSRRRPLGTHVLRAMLASCAAMDGCCWSWAAAVVDGGDGGVLAMPAITCAQRETCASDMSR